MAGQTPEKAAIGPEALPGASADHLTKTRGKCLGCVDAAAHRGAALGQLTKLQLYIGNTLTALFDLTGPSH